MAIWDKLASISTMKQANLQDGTETVEVPPERTEMFDAVASSVQNTTPQVTHHKGRAEIDFVPNTLLGTGSDYKIGKRKARTQSDYSMFRAERFYEKEGMIRKYAAMAAAKIMRGKFKLVMNEEHPSAKRQDLHERTVDRAYEVMENSGLSWLEIIQTIAKEMYVFGNSFIMKQGKGKYRVNKIILDDPVFYEAVVDAYNLRTEYYARRPYLRPKPASEDNFNKMFQSMGLTPNIMGSDLSFSWSLYKSRYLTGVRKSSKEERLNRDQVIHMRYMIEKNAAFAMPPLMAAAIDLDDLKTLEDNMILLAWQYGHPLLHVTVDVDGLGYERARQEISDAIGAVERMQSVGFLATTNRVTVKMNYPDGTQVPIDKFINHINSRINKSLDTADLLLGDGADAGRQAGETIESASNDMLYMIAQLMAEKLQSGLIRPIYYDVGGDPNRNIPATKIKVIEIDRNRQTARINNMTNGMNVGGVERDEWREEMELPPLTDDQREKIAEYFIDRKREGDETQTVNPVNQRGETSPGSTTN